MAKDYYQILGVTKKADEKEVKSAYRKLARKYHPDVNPSDKSAEAKFKEVSEAYEVLGNPEKRKLYDQFGQNWEAAQNFTGAQPNGGEYEFHFGPGGGGGGFESVFEHLFGGMGGQAGAGRFRTGFGGFDVGDIETARPRDIEKVVEVSLEEVDKGTKRVLTYQTMDAQRMRDQIATVPSTKKVEVTIPAGIPDGKKLRVPGRGHAGINNKAGDLYVTVKWAPHATFKVVGDNLEVEVPVPYTLAALGGEVKVPTLRASVSMKIPGGTQSGQTFRLAGQGIARMGGGRGDLMARIKITVPKRPSEREKQLLQELADLEKASA